LAAFRFRQILYASGPISDGRANLTPRRPGDRLLQPKVSAMLISLAFAIVTMIIVLTSQAVPKLAQKPLRYG